jgi:hypothetical protein
MTKDKLNTFIVGLGLCIFVVSILYIIIVTY